MAMQLFSFTIYAASGRVLKRFALLAYTMEQALLHASLMPGYGALVPVWPGKEGK